jgi:adenosylcobinamide-GDP ribazoletransferase
VRQFLAAVRFLTVFWVPGQLGTRTEDLAGSVSYFPLVGLLIGGLAAALACGVVRILPPLPASVIIVILWLAASGAFHLDGLADTADGFLSSRPCERILEIMKDSHIGSMGVVVLVCALLLKTAALGSMSPRDMCVAAFLTPVAGRCALVIMMALLPYARPEGGLGKLFAPGHPAWRIVWAVGVLTAVGWFAVGVEGLLAAVVVTMITALFSLYCHRKIGGMTGDTLGAACELAEVAMVTTLATEAFLRF